MPVAKKVACPLSDKASRQTERKTGMYELGSDMQVYQMD
jgi:hypothetical protein